MDHDLLVAIDEVSAQYKPFWDFCREDAFGPEGFVDSRNLSACHRSLCDFLCAPRHVGAKEQEERLTLWARGHLKTSVGSVAYPIWRMIYNPDIRILIASETEKMSSKIIGSIRQVIESDRFKAKYGDWVGRGSWSGNSLTISTRRKKTLRDPSVAVASVETSEVGGHCDLIICDDLHSEKNITSREMIEKVAHFRKLLFPILDPGGDIFFIGTRWDEGDIYGQQIIDLPKSCVSIRKVIENGKILFPESFNQPLIDSIRKRLGTYMFNLLYMNEPTAAEDAVFRPEWLDKCMWRENTLPEGMTYYISVDPAISENRDADFTAIVVAGIEKDKDIWHIVDVVNERLSPTHIIEQIFRMAKQWNPVKVGIEVVSYQKMLRNWVEREMLARREYFFIEELKPGQRSKTTRIEALMPRVEYQSIRWDPRFTLLTDQFRRFRRDREQSHDDVVDAVAYFADMVPPMVGSSEPTYGHADKSFHTIWPQAPDPNEGKDWSTQDFSHYRRVG